MLPEGFSRRDAMLVLSAMSRIGSISTSEGVSGRIGTPEVHDALRRMERPEDFWDVLWALTDDRILSMEREPRGDVRFAVVDVQAHDVATYLWQHREEVESFGVLDPDEGLVTRVYLEGLEETRARAVFY